MSHQITISDEELDHLEGMISHELETSHHELRRTRNPGFRGQILRRIEVVEHLLESCRQVHAAQV